MKEWEKWVVFSSMISVALFVLLTVLNYIFILYNLPNLGAFFPIKAIIVIGITWWIIVTILTIYYEFDSENGAIWYLLTFLSVSAIVGAIYVAFFSEKIQDINDVSHLTGAGLAGVLIYGSVSLIVGIISLVYYTFLETREWREIYYKLKYFK